MLPKLKVDIFAGHERLAGAWRTVPGGPGDMVGYPTPTLTLRLPSRRSRVSKSWQPRPWHTEASQWCNQQRITMLRDPQ